MFASLPRLIPLLILFSLLVGKGRADELYQSLDPKRLGLELKQVRLNDELLTSRVSALLHSREGELWIGTFSGLIHYDGIRSQKFTPQNSPGLPHHNILSLCQGYGGCLYIGTSTGQIACLKEDQFQPVPLPDQWEFYGNWCAYGKEGFAAVVKTGDGPALAHWNGREWVEILGKDNKATWGIPYAVGENSLFFLLGKGGVQRIQNETIQDLKLPAQAAPAILFQGLQGQWYAQGPAGVYRFENDEFVEHFRFPGTLTGRQRPSRAVEDIQGRIWFQIEHLGIFLLEPDGKFHRLVASAKGLPSAATSLLSDHDGNVWIGSFTGLVQARAKQWVSWEMPDDLRSRAALKLRRSPADGSIWISSYGGICQLRQGDTLPRLVIPRPAKEIIFFDVAPDGSVFHGNKEKEFFRWNDGQSEPIELNTPVKDLSLRGMVCDENSEPWLVGLKGIYHAKQNDGKWKFDKVSGSNGLPDTSFKLIQTGQDHSLRAYSLREGLFEKKARLTEWRFVAPPLKQRGQQVMGPNNQIWYFDQARRRLGLTEGNSSTTRTLDSLGLPDLRVLSLQTNQPGKVWLLTDQHGLIELNRDDFVNETSGAIRHTKLDGLISNAFSYTTNAFLTTPDQSIWVATMEGISMKPLRSSSNQSPVVSLREVWIDDREVTNEQLLELKESDHSTLTLKLGTNSLGFVGETRFQFRLGNKRGPWQEISENGILELTKLAPGNYPVEFRAVVSGRPGSEILSLPLRILPPWWQRPLGIATISALAFILGWLLLRHQLSRSRELQQQQEHFTNTLIDSQESERKRIARELHDGIGQHLLLIKNSAELSRQNLPEEKQAPLATISQYAADAISETRAIMTGLRPVTIDRLGLIAALQDMLRRSASSVDLTLETELDALEQAWTESQKIAIFRLVQEATNNVLKHAQASKLSVHSSVIKEQTVITIQDDGQGFATNQSEANPSGIGQGLTGMKERCRLLGGRLQILSTPDSGTRVEIRIPNAPSSS